MMKSSKKWGFLPPPRDKKSLQNSFDPFFRVTSEGKNVLLLELCCSTGPIRGMSSVPILHQLYQCVSSFAHFIAGSWVQLWFVGMVYYHYLLVLVRFSFSSFGFCSFKPWLSLSDISTYAALAVVAVGSQLIQIQHCFSGLPITRRIMAHCNILTDRWIDR